MARTRIVAGAALAALALTATAAGAQDRTITNLKGSTGLDVEGDLALLGVWDRPERTQLSILRGGAITPLPISPKLDAGADIGTDAAGTPTVVFRTCELQAGGRCSGAELSRLALHADGTAAGAPEPIEGTRGGATPTVSGGTLAFSRAGKIYTRPLDGGARPVSQPVAPKRNCRVLTKGSRKRAKDPCRVRNVTVTALELRGEKLAVNVVYGVAGGVVDIAAEEVRLVDIGQRTGARVRVAKTSHLEAVSIPYDPSFDAEGRLLLGNRMTGGLLRYDARARGLERAEMPAKPRPVAAAALGAGALFVFDGGDGRYPLVQADTLGWRK